MNIWSNTLISVCIVSSISLVGVFSLFFKPGFLQKILFYLVSFAVGGLLGDAFIHLLPEAYAKIGNSILTPVYIMFGLLFFFILEKILRWHHCKEYQCEPRVKPVVSIVLLGDTVHNFVDGMVIAASYLINFQVGFSTTIAVILHEIPHEVGDFGVLINGGLSVKKALLFNFLSALAAILGAVVSLLLGPAIGGFSVALLPITAGGFIYIAGSDLIPELHSQTTIPQSILQLLFIIAGVAVMFTLLLFGS